MLDKHCCNDSICASLSFYFQNIITFFFKKLSCAVEILILSDAVNFLTKSLGMPYSVITAQQPCSTEIVQVHRDTVHPHNALGIAFAVRLSSLINILKYISLEISF